jgi:hypothetical protein
VISQKVDWDFYIVTAEWQDKDGNRIGEQFAFNANETRVVPPGATALVLITEPHGNLGEQK